jgi:AcrR family transcriptional regulator
MSPARSLTSVDEIVTAGRELLEAGGLDAVTMLAVAQRVGVRAPSLYKRVPSRAALIAAIAAGTFDELGRGIEPFIEDPDPKAGLRSMATAYRAFAHVNPRAYELLFMNLPPDHGPTADHNLRSAAPLLALATRLVGADQALDAARLVTAFAHGFVSMELGGAFRLGGDVDEAYRYGVEVLVDALTSRVTAPASGRRESPGPALPA